MFVSFKPFSAPRQGKSATARSFNDALGLNATVPMQLVAAQLPAGPAPDATALLHLAVTALDVLH